MAQITKLRVERALKRLRGGALSKSKATQHDETIDALNE
jgi:hypothetical protein